MNINKIIAIILVLSTFICISSCKKEEQDKVLENAIIDAVGKEIEIPQDPENITIASTYAVAVPFLSALQVTDKVVAINAKTRFWTANDENLDNAGSVGRGVVDLEALAKVAPDVFINNAFSDKVRSSVENLGIDYISIKAENIDEIYQTLTLLGKYCGATQRADEVIGYMKEKFAKIDEIVAKIPEDERVTALVFGGEIGKVASEDMIQSWMVEKAGGISLSKGIESNSGWAMIGTEEIFTLNPKYIFPTGSTVLEYSISELIEDKTWSDVLAIKNENIYQIPAKIHAWDLPGVEPVIGTFWLLNTMYSQYFSEEELQAEIDEYYTFFFGKTFEKDYLGY